MTSMYLNIAGLTFSNSHHITILQDYKGTVFPFFLSQAGLHYMGTWPRSESWPDMSGSEACLAASVEVICDVTRLARRTETDLTSRMISRSHIFFQFYTL